MLEPETELVPISTYFPPIPSPFKRYVSLNFVVSATLSISVTSASISDWMYALSLSAFVPLAA